MTSGRTGRWRGAAFAALGSASGVFLGFCCSFFVVGKTGSGSADCAGVAFRCFAVGGADLGRGGMGGGFGFPFAAMVGRTATFFGSLPFVPAGGLVVACAGAWSLDFWAVFPEGAFDSLTGVAILGAGFWGLFGLEAVLEVFFFTVDLLRAFFSGFIPQSRHGWRWHPQTGALPLV